MSHVKRRHLLLVASVHSFVFFFFSVCDYTCYRGTTPYCALYSAVDSSRFNFADLKELKAQWRTFVLASICRFLLLCVTLIFVNGNMNIVMHLQHVLLQQQSVFP